MKSNRSIIAICAVALIVLVSACTPKPSDSPERSVELYLSALVEKDGASLAGLSCASWEPNALMELDSFQAVEVYLSDLSCESSGSENQFKVVKCEGFLVATYNGENQNIDLSARDYLVQESSNGYLVCGYKWNVGYFLKKISMQSDFA